MARTLAEAQAMSRRPGRSGASLMVAHCWRFHPRVGRYGTRIAAASSARW